MMISHVEAEGAYGMSLAILAAKRSYLPGVKPTEPTDEAQLAVVEASTGE